MGYKFWRACFVITYIVMVIFGIVIIIIGAINIVRS